MKKIFLLIIGLSIGQGLMSQNVGVNDDGSSPDPSAVLDVKSNSKGILVPRLNSAQRQAIPLPARGLLVFDLDKEAFWYYTGVNWVELNDAFHGLRDQDNDTKIQVEESTDEDIIRFDLGGTEHFTMKGPRLEVQSSGASVFIGQGAGQNDDLSVNNNVFIGNLSGSANTTGYTNVGLGSYSLFSNSSGYFNTANGFQSLYSNTIGLGNTAQGYRSLFSNLMGYSNVAIGAGALYHNISGHNLVAVGDSALFNQAFNPTALYENTAIGSKALFSNTTGSYNSAGGFQSLNSNTTGNENTAFGYRSLRNMNTGVQNTAVGAATLERNSTGSRNTSIGFRAGYNSSNTDCTFLGANANVNNGLVNYTNSTALGYNSKISADHQVRIGNTTITSIGGYANWTNLSDARFKQNIAEDIVGLDFILALRPVSYQLDIHKLSKALNENKSIKGELFEANELNKVARNKKASIRYSGFLAQEVEQSAQKAGYDFSGVDLPQNEHSFYGLRYAEFTVPLVKSVQELYKELETLKAENLELKSKVDQIEILKTELEIIKNTLNNQ